MTITGLSFSQDPYLVGLTHSLENAVVSFCHVAKLSVTYFDISGQMQWECAPQHKLCSLFSSYESCQPLCQKSLLSAARTAAQLGEPYIFLCTAGLVKVAFPLIAGGENHGCLFAGPLAMGTKREKILKKLMARIPCSPEIFPNLPIFLSRMAIYNPKDIAYLADVFHHVVLAALTQNKDYTALNQIYKEQSRASETIQRQKLSMKEDSDYPYELESELIQCVKNGDQSEAVKKLQLFLEKIFILEEGNLPFIKIRILGLCTILSRIAPQNQLNLKKSFRYLENMEKLNRTAAFQDLSDLSQQIISEFTKSIENNLYSGQSSIISKSIRYVNENYRKPLTLTKVAKEIHTNPSYLSTLFKKEMGISFTAYLTELRLKGSEELLEETNLNLTDIASLVGFESQSYFTKMFKLKNGLTPSQYRKTRRKDRF